MSAPDVRTELRRTLTTIFEPGTVFEARVLNRRDGRTGPCAGYYNDVEKALQAIAEWDGHAEGVYIIPNLVKPEILARSNNRLRNLKNMTSDADILRRRWLLLDFDPKRPSGISATEQEHEAALDRARQTRDWLLAQGWSEPIFADSGNGAHLLCPIDLPNDDDSHMLVQKSIHAIGMMFADETVEVDLAVHNAARLIRAYGTLTAKGDPTEDRPHRRSKILELPRRAEIVPPDLLLRLASRVPYSNGKQKGFDVADWIAQHHLPVVATGPWNGSGTRWILNPCPWNPDHRNRSAYIVKFDKGGGIAAGCHHNSCIDKGWPELRDAVEPGWNRFKTPSQPRSDRGSAENDIRVPVFDPAIEPPPPQRIFDGLLSFGDLSVYIGREKHRKTNMLLQLAICAAVGRDFLHFRFAAARPLKVVMFDYESKTAKLKERYDAICNAMQLTGDQRILLKNNLSIVELRKANALSSHIPRFPVKPRNRNDQDFEEAEQWWRTYVNDCNADLYIFDPMRCLHVEDENDSNIEQLLTRLREICAGRTNVVSHHTRKYVGKREDQVALKDDMRWWSDACRGSGAIKAHADVVICQERVMENSTETIYLGAFSKDEADVNPIRLEESGPLSFYWEVKMTLPPHLRETFKALQPQYYDSPGAAAQWLIEHAGFSKSTAYRHVNELLQSGFLIQVGDLWMTK
jgi:hypothetical protein